MFQTKNQSVFGGANAAAGATAVAAAVAPNPLKDIELPNGPTDCVSNLEFSPKSNHLIASSWDGTVKCWDIQTQTGQINLLGQQAHEGPILDCAWHADGTKVFTASADKIAKVWDLQSNQAMAVAQHDAPIKTVHWIQGTGYQCLMTGSWDKTVKFWDTRSPTPSMQFTLPERVYGADVVFPLAVVITASRGVHCYQLDPQPSYARSLDTILKHQLRCVAICRDKTNANPIGMALGCIEGRVAIEYPDSGPKPVSGKSENSTFQFKCHRQTETNSSVQDIYSVHNIKFHPVHRGLFVTCGADGLFTFWDKDARVRLTQSPSHRQPQAVTAGCFSTQGDMFAYATGYDWTKGHGHTNQNGSHVYLTKCDIQPSQSKGRK